MVIYHDALKDTENLVSDGVITLLITRFANNFPSVRYGTIYLQNMVKNMFITKKGLLQIIL